MRFITAEEERPLTERHREVLKLLAAGNTNAQIALALRIAQKTVSKHVEAIYRRLGVQTRVAAARWWWEYVELPDRLARRGITWPP